MNKMFSRAGCHHCRPILMPVVNTNNVLPTGKRIDIIDSILWENFGINFHPIQNKIKFEGYPHLHLGGINIIHFLSADQTKNFLDGFFENDKRIREVPEFMKGK